LWILIENEIKRFVNKKKAYMMEENFALIRDGQLDQIGIVVSDTEKVAASFHTLLGIGPFEYFELPGDEPDDTAEYYGKSADWKIKIAFAQSGPLGLELIQPLSGKSIFKDFLDEHGPGLHHLRYLVPDVEKCILDVEKKGFQIISKGKGAHKNSRWAYIDTSDILDGVLIEIRIRL
jgi:hypothetical protein